MKLLEYDLEVKPTKPVRGRGLEKLMAEVNYDALGMEFCEISEQGQEEEQQPAIVVSDQFSPSPWYVDIVYFLQNLQCPTHLSKTTTRFLKLRAVKFYIIKGYLFYKDLGGLLLNCVTEEEAKALVEEFHHGTCGGNLYWKVTVNKILREGFYWPTIYVDVFKMVSACHKCQIF